MKTDCPYELVIGLDRSDRKADLHTIDTRTGSARKQIIDTAPERLHEWLAQVRELMRVRRYALRTERAYCDWIRRYVKFHGMQGRADLGEGTRKVEEFLTHLAVNEEVAPSTQNQALNALLFLYGQVLEEPLEGRINAVRAERRVNVPVVLTPEEARQVVAVLQGVPQLVVKLLYGSGLRVMEALRLRVQDVDFGRLQVRVRAGKGNKDRVSRLHRRAC